MNLKNFFSSVHFRIFIVVIGIGLIYSRYAISVGQTITEDPIIQAAASTNTATNVGRESTESPMIRAAATGNCEDIRKLLKGGYSTNVVADVTDGPLAASGPLALAVWSSNYEPMRKAVDILLTHQAHVSARDMGQQCPIHKLIRIDLKDIRMDMLGRLIRFGASISSQNSRGDDILAMIAVLNDTIFVDMMLDWWGKIISPAMIERAVKRCREDNFRDMEVTLQKGPTRITPSPYWEPNKIDPRTGLNDLHFSVINNDANAIKLILDKGVNCNIPSDDTYGLRPLHYAVLHQLPAIVALLVENKAQINATDLRGNSPLIYIASLENEKIALQIADYLLQKGANLNLQNNEGNTLLHILIYNNNKELINLIGKKYKFNRTVRNGDRENAIELAARLNRNYLLKDIA